MKKIHSVPRYSHHQSWLLIAPSPAPCQWLLVSLPCSWELEGSELRATPTMMVSRLHCTPREAVPSLTCQENQILKLPSWKRYQGFDFFFKQESFPILLGRDKNHHWASNWDYLCHFSHLPLESPPPATLYALLSQTRDSLTHHPPLESTLYPKCAQAYPRHTCVALLKIIQRYPADWHHIPVHGLHFCWNKAHVFPCPQTEPHISQKGNSLPGSSFHLIPESLSKMVAVLTYYRVLKVETRQVEWSL